MRFECAWEKLDYFVCICSTVTCYECDKLGIKDYLIKVLFFGHNCIRQIRRTAISYYVLAVVRGRIPGTISVDTAAPVQRS